MTLAFSQYLTVAESRVRNTDMVKEMMSYTKNNTLVQATQAMITQSNMIPQGMLQLLRQSVTRFMATRAAAINM